MSESAEGLFVEVAYALHDKQKIIGFNVPKGTTAREAVTLSGIAELFPEIDVAAADLGIFGKVLGVKGLKPADEYQLEERDRVEIYRPLIADPKEARKARATKKAKTDDGTEKE